MNMRILKIRKNFFNQNKEEAMKAYQITKAEYKYIHSLGIRKDAQGKVMDEWEVEIPDNLDVVPQKNQPYSPPVQNSSNCCSNGAPNQQLGFAQNVQPFFAPQPYCSQHQALQQMGGQCLDEALRFMREVEQRRNSPGYNEEQCKLDIQQANWYAHMIDKCMNTAEHIQFNQVTTMMNFGGSTTYVTAVNTPMADWYMKMDLIGKGIGLLGKLAESLDTLARATKTLFEVIEMMRGRRNSN